jgi:hypothetical protein
VPEQVREALTFHLADDISEVLGHALAVGQDEPAAQAA